MGPDVPVLLAALLAGLVGSTHCAVMCGGIATGFSAMSSRPGWGSALQLNLGRVAGYALAGALVGAFGGGLLSLARHQNAVLAMRVGVGLALVVLAQQPVWLETGARRIWSKVRSATQSMGMAAPLGLGVAWALLPCGLLYSALMVAALAGSVAGGMAVMAVFAIGSGVSLWAGPWLLLRLGSNGRGAWSMRIAGLALMAVSAWGLYMGLVHDQAPWCVVP